MDSRRLALKILMDLQINKGYSNIIVRKYLNNTDLNVQDRAFTTELVYGVIEKKYLLDYIINKKSKIKVKKMSNYVKIILRMAVYELICLNSQSYAAINEAVKMSKKYDRRSSGFVNGVLRSIDREKKQILDEIDNLPDNEKYSIKYSINKWIVNNFIKDYGKERAKKILDSLSERPKLYVRRNIKKIDKDGLEKAFKDENINFEPLAYPEDVYTLKATGGMDRLEVFKMGLITVQDVSSMLPVMMMNPQKDDIVLDLCSAPGGKAMQIGELVGSKGRVLALDLYDHKIDLIKSYSKRMGLENIYSKKADALKFDEDLVEKFDSVLADLPCSGLGIIRRKPEIKYKNQEDIKDLPSIQGAILSNAGAYVKEGGSLIYSTCTLNYEENLAVVREFLKNNPNFVSEDVTSLIDLEALGGEVVENTVTIVPDLKGFDGFFAVKLKKLTK